MELIQQEYIDELASTPISDLLDAEGIRIIGKGKSTQVSCISPDHEDKNPSMSINTDTGKYHCHSCGCGGSGVLSMYAEMNRLDYQKDFRNIVEGLSAVLGKTVEYQKRSDPLSQARLKQYEALTAVVKSSLDIPYFEDDREAFSKALTERGITRGERQNAKIGMLAKNFSKSPIAKKYEKELLEAGLLTKHKDTGNIYSKFAGRMIMPITNRSNHIIGIAGRQIKESDQGPKYYNSNETVVFKKHRTLYGLHAATDGANGKLDNLDVVEGYFDVITAQAKRFKHTVAAMGTAATVEHFREISRVSRGVTFIFDPDEAGRKASIRAMLNGLPFVDSLDIKFATMPVIGEEKLDPDAFLKKYSEDEYQAIKDQARPIYELAAEYVLGEETETIQSAIQNGMLERGSEVYQYLPTGMVKSLYTSSIAKEISKHFDLSLTPEQLGLSISEQERIKELESQIKHYQKQLSAPSTPKKVKTNTSDSIAQREIQREDNPQTRKVKNNSYAQKDEVPFTGKGTELIDQMIEGASKLSDLIDTSEHRKSLQQEVQAIKERCDSYASAMNNEANLEEKEELANALKTSMALMQQKMSELEALKINQANQQPENQPAKKAANKEKAKPFSLSYFREYPPTEKNWVALTTGEIAKVKQAYPNGVIEIEGINGVAMPDCKIQDCITLEPKRVMRSKYDGENHKAGDSILLLSDKWWADSVPTEYIRTAKEIIDNKIDVRNNPHILQSIATMVKSTSSKIEKQPSEQSHNELLEFIGLNDFTSQRQVQTRPPQLFIDRRPERNDYVAVMGDTGTIYEVTNVTLNEIQVRDTTTQKEIPLDLKTCKVLNPTAKALSKFDSDIAVKGQPIFKFERDGQWMGKLPEDWMENPKEYSPSPSPA